MSRKITNDACDALFSGRAFRRDNTRVEDRTMFLHGSPIATINDAGTLWVSTCGHETPTTKERLNGVTGVGVCIEDGYMFLNGVLWEDSSRWTAVSGPRPDDPGPNGYIHGPHRWLEGAGDIFVRIGEEPSCRESGPYLRAWLSSSDLSNSALCYAQAVKDGEMLTKVVAALAFRDGVNPPKWRHVEDYQSTPMKISRKGEHRILSIVHRKANP